ncbi:hypothetical protein GQ54DRAFT_307975 [Martensiomyces pterosporus]|nr:hypothetical protein GQ54DRAFT_307975 [Martensiomyces pterosporus]
MAADKKADGKHLSSKLQTMKFMQRSADRAKADAEKKLERKMISESHWRASYPDDVVPEEKPKVRVIYESSYLRMPKGDTTVRADGTATHGSSGSGAGAFVGRRSFRLFNKQVEQLSEESAAQQREEESELREKRLAVDDETMAKALAGNASSSQKEPASLRERNKRYKRKRD